MRDAPHPDPPTRCCLRMASTPASVPIKAFCAFTARSGDLDLRFTPVPTAPEGIAGHRTVVFSRRGDYRSEVAVEGVVDGLRLRGRIDGVEADGQTLDEIKTQRQPANHRALHRAQLRTYAALYARAEGHEQLTLRLCYYDIDRRNETQIVELARADALWTELESRVAQYKRWMAGERAHRQRRDTVLDGLAFPYPEIPEGQRQLLQAVEHAYLREQRLLAQAPTGVGKTLGVLFPSLKALAAGRVDQLFYLTPRNAVQMEISAALTRLRPPGAALPLRVLVLNAKERACVHPDKACHGASCPLAQGFFDRLPAAREAARAEAWLSAEALAAIAATHHICPYFLAQEMTQWADLIIGDVNYYLDVHALLHALVTHTGARIGLMMDEAHNLVDRARAMYSGELRESQLHAGMANLPKRLRPAIAPLLQQIDLLALQWATTDGSPALLEEAPKALRTAFSQAISRIGQWFAEQPERASGAPLQFYFELIAFHRLLERLAAHSLFELEQGTGPARDLLNAGERILRIRNVVPAPHLEDRFRAAHTVIAFSATLLPWHYHQLLLGLPETSRFIDLPSRFSPNQLQVRLARQIRTDWRVRGRTAAAVATAIADEFETRPGNYLVFCSSFHYLDQVAHAFAQRAPQIPQQRQRPQMGEADRKAFLARYSEHSQQVGFVVLGGSFSEGINLEGRRLIGAVICNLGLTPYTLASRRMAERIDRYFGPGTGEDFIHLYPAVTRVVQAAGRVVRTLDDHGSLLLIDQRFASDRVRRLLPTSWFHESNRTTAARTPDSAVPLRGGDPV
jgi:DNA excision repair protein ERCC-2